jgi:UDP-N-acetylmuramoyl-tripeptide--D-alanyl-D-alanine ligase
VGSAHLGEFGSPAAIAAAKGELVEALPADGVAVLNADDPAVAAMAGRTSARIVTFGLAPDAAVRAEDVELDAGRPRFTLLAPGGCASVALQLVGEHHVGNALAAAAVALELGATVDGVAAALGAAVPASRWRMEVVDRADGVTVVNDAYNANPESMRAALQALVALGGERRRTWAVLGRIAELGEGTAAAHADVAAVAHGLGVDELVAVGTTDYPGARRTDSVGEALALLRAELAPGDVVLVKASRAAGLERVAAGLLDVRDDVRSAGAPRGAGAAGSVSR